MKKELDLQTIISKAFSNGLKNFVPLLITFILWLVTIWIPVINVGTTIAIYTIPAKLSRGTIINPMSIFDKQYRSQMGDFFLVCGFTSLITSMGYLFMVIPGIIMTYTYLFAPMLVADKGISAFDALTKSKEMTNGNKLTIFFSIFILFIPFIIPIINFIYFFLFAPVALSALGYIYEVLYTEEEESETV